MSDHYTLLSWARDGVAALLEEPEGLDATGPARAPLEVALDVTRLPGGGGAADESDTVTMPFAMLGPGDVRHLDLDKIVRTDPPANTTGFEPHHVPLIEFRRADLPWLFSARAGSDQTRQKLRPWLSLVVVPVEQAVLKPIGKGGPMRLSCPLRELPEPEDSWAWAHAQVLNLSEGESLANVLEHHPERACSRLLAARRLAPGTAYHACLVPTFKAGVQAAFAERDIVDTLDSAWPSPDNASAGITAHLPVFFHWRFTTGEAGSFEQLARRLQPHSVTVDSAVREVDVSSPGAGLVIHDDDEPRERLPLPSALVPAGFRLQRWETPMGQRFEAQMREKFDALADAGRRVVGPPLYARWHAAADRPPAAGDAPHWLRDLNLDPRLRAVAGLGVQSVQRHQEAFMASAWAQLDEVEAVNRVLRQGQLAREVSSSLMRRHVAPLRPAAVLQMSGNALTALSYGGVSVRQALGASTVPGGLVSAALRRTAGAAGPLARRVARFATFDAAALTALTVAGDIGVPAAPRTSTGTVYLNMLSAARAVFPSTHMPDQSFAPNLLSMREFGYKSQGFDRFVASAPLPIGGSSKPLNITLDTKAKMDACFELSIHVMRRERLLGAPAPDEDGDALDAADLAGELRAQLDPDVGITDHVQSLIDSELALGGELPDAIRAAPEIDQPMVHVLQELAPESLLPGVAKLPPNSVSLVRASSAFVHAYLIGMNHAMAAELSWRGFPTDQRGTVFRRFWDRDGHAQGSGDTRDFRGPMDIAPLHALPPDLRLLDGEQEFDERLMLLVRSDLLRRFPDTWVSVCPAVEQRGVRAPVSNRTRSPDFSARVGDDVALFAFDLSVAEARGSQNDPGWFVQFREPPSGLRFGLDEPSQSTPAEPASVDDLSWQHVMDGAGGSRYAATRHTTLPDDHVFAERVGWGVNGAHMARCFMQWPVSVAIHADSLLPGAD